MLRTTTESLEEHQPLTNEDESLVLVMDGRVDNWEDLRRELLGCGAVLRNRSDAELVLRAYEIWGRDCLARIDGDFALVIWDARRQEAFCARDRMGAKPFNYQWNGRTLRFCSEIHSILASLDCPTLINEGMVSEFLSTEWYARDETLWVGVRRLVASHSLTVNNNDICVERYWRPNLATEYISYDDSDYVEHYRELFLECVRRASRSSSPLACEVSGGLDSSAIFSMAHHLESVGKLPAPAVRGYTLTFCEPSAADELEYAQSVAAHLGTVVEPVSATEKPLSWYLDWAWVNREFPPSPTTVMLEGLRKRSVQVGARVILSGVGGDEWTGGGAARYAEVASNGAWLQLLSMLKSDCLDLGTIVGCYRAFRLTVPHLLPNPVISMLRKSLLTNQVMGKSYNRRFLTPNLRASLTEKAESFSKSIPKVSRPGQMRLYLLLENAYLAWASEASERAAAAVGIEVRRPFRSRKFVEFAFATPDRLKHAGRYSKFLHRLAMQEALPRDVLQRTSKAEFSIVANRLLPQIESYTAGDKRFANRERWVDMKYLRETNSRGERQLWRNWALWSLVGCEAVAAA